MRTAVAVLVILMINNWTVEAFYCPPRCRCDSHLRVVKCNTLKLTQAPKCDNSTLSLFLIDNWIATLQNESFTGLSQLENVSLVSNLLTDIDIAAFQPLINIRLINLAGNTRLPLDSLAPVFCYISKTIQVLSLYNLKKLSKTKTLKSSLFRCLRNSNLTQLDLSNNGIHALPGSIFTDLTNLRILFLRGNNLDTVETGTFAGLSNLRWLDLRDNHLSKIPNFGNETHPFFPKLFELSLGYNNIDSVKPIDFIALKNVMKLDLEWNLIQILPNNMFKYMPKLQHVMLKQQRNLRSILPMAFASSSLIYLDISVNKYIFYSNSYDFFSKSPNLHDLYLHNNQLNNLNSTALETMFRNLTQLRKLYIQNTGLSFLPPNVFVNNGMMSELQLQSNFLSTWDPIVFQPLLSLRKLFMDHNNIRILNETSFPQFIWDNLTDLNLAGNPFSCTCENLWFRNWIQSTNVKLLQLHAYLCYEPKKLSKSPFLDWHPTKAQCTPLPAWVIASAIGVSAMLFLALVTLATHRYRWYIRYWCFTLRSRYKRLEPFEDNGTYVFDAFVSYNCHDRPWVIQRLLPKLEYDAGFKLGLHDRDFIVGHDIVDNIVDGIDVSRKTILVLSNNFAQSQWCQLEMTMAQHKLFDENKDILVLILLGDIKPENLSNRLTLLLRKQTYIEWPSEEEGQDLFWERVKAALQKPSGYGTL